MKKIKILITGSTGFVGKKFAKKILDACNAEIIFTSFSRDSTNSIKVDLTNAVEVNEMLNMVKPTHLFHFAAMVNPKRNEENKMESFQKNFIITNNIINVCDNNTKIYFLSTDKVYNPDNRNSGENEISEVPDNFYSLMKLICEEIIVKKFPKHFIFRCPIIHSSGEVESNSFIDNAILQLSKGQQIKAYTNVIRHYIFVNELVDFLISIIDSEEYGIFNIGTEPKSYFDRIFSIAASNNYDTSLVAKDIGNVSPIIQIFNLTKFKNIFKTTFN